MVVLSSHETHLMLGSKSLVCAEKFKICAPPCVVQQHGVRVGALVGNRHHAATVCCQAPRNNTPIQDIQTGTTL